MTQIVATNLNSSLPKLRTTVDLAAPKGFPRISLSCSGSNFITRGLARPGGRAGALRARLRLAAGAVTLALGLTFLASTFRFAQQDLLTVRPFHMASCTCRSWHCMCILADAPACLVADNGDLQCDVQSAFSHDPYACSRTRGITKHGGCRSGGSLQKHQRCANLSSSRSANLLLLAAAAASNAPTMANNLYRTWTCNHDGCRCRWR